VATIPSTSSTNAEYADKGLSAATTYTYAIAAVDAAGDLSAQSNAASATTVVVPTAYPTCGQTVLSVPGSYPTIQAAINAASIGDTIEVATGTYSENVNLVSGICLEGAGIDQTIISKSGASGITGNSVSYVIIKGLTVQDSGCAPGACGGGGNGGGIQLSNSSNITIQSCRLTGNVAVDGGGISLSQSSVTMDHCLIDGNTANNVGAGIAMNSASTVSLTNVTVANNNWVNALGNGGVGGIQSDGSGLQMVNSIVWGNNSQNFSGNGSQISNSDIGGWSGGTNNITSNPGFVSGTDYNLQAGSPSAGMGLY